jgi:hypothetical protein
LCAALSIFRPWGFDVIRPQGDADIFASFDSLFALKYPAERAWPCWVISPLKYRSLSRTEVHRFLPMVDISASTDAAVDLSLILSFV